MLRSVSVYCMEVCVTYTFVTMSTCLRLPAASIQCPLTPSHCRPEWADKTKEEEMVRKRWRIALNSGSRSANVQKR